mgnify:CR=1 FL=1
MRNLLGRITLALGLILALEVSRFARNSAEWYRLLELAALADVLIGDEASLPYQRPPLSKAHLKLDAEDAQLHFRPDAFFAERRIELLVGQSVGDEEVPVNRTDAIAFLGGAQNTNEECYLFQKAARLLGFAYVEHQARL